MNHNFLFGMSLAFLICGVMNISYGEFHKESNAVTYCVLPAQPGKSFSLPENLNDCDFVFKVSK